LTADANTLRKYRETGNRSDKRRVSEQRVAMAPQRTVLDHRVLDSELRKPLLATSCAAHQNIRPSRSGLFTESARSATINHNNLDTCELPALILGKRRGGFESEFLLRARRGNEAGRRRSANCPSHAARTLAIHSPCSRAVSFMLHQAIADIGHPCAGYWHYTPEEGKNERQSHGDWARSD